MKRVIFILFAVLFGGTLTAQNRFTIGDLTYEVLNGGNSVEVHDCDTSATSVDIPSTVTNNETTYSVTSIGRLAFSGCNNLTAINVDSGNTHYSSIDEVLYNYAQDTLIRCPEAKSSVTIPNKVTYIRNNAFSHCNNLTSVSIPNSVKSIGEMAFSDCSNLTAINVDSGNTHYSSIDGVLYNYAQDTLIRCPEAKSSVNIPNSVTYIRNNAFYACNNLTSVSIPNNVTYIGYGAFSDCSSLTLVTISNSVTYIGDVAFAGCHSLTSVHIPNSVTSIGDWAFSSCSSLTSISIPKSVKSIGERVFSGCSSLTAINVDSGNTHYSSIDGILYNHAQDTLIRCPEAKLSVTIPNKVTTIEHEAFSDCSNLTSIIIPKSVTFIGCHAFSDCSSLTSIISLAYTPPVSAGCFFGIKSDCSIIIPCKSMTAYQTSDYWIYLFYTNNITGSYYTEISATINEGETYTEYGFNDEKIRRLRQHNSLAFVCQCIFVNNRLGDKTKKLNKI